MPTPTFFYYSGCVYQQYLKINGDCKLDERRRSFCVESPFSLSHISCSVKRAFAFEIGKGGILLTILLGFLLLCALYPHIRPFIWIRTVVAKMKGIYKGVKYTLSQIFVVKEEHEMEIGCPTDVKHVAHIGWDGASGSAPSWMNEFTTGNDFAATSIGNTGSSISTWSSRDSNESTRQRSLSESETCKDAPSTDSGVKKREKRKKPKPTTSLPNSSSSCSSRPRQTRAGKPKSKFIDDNAKPTNIEVA